MKKYQQEFIESARMHYAGLSKLFKQVIMNHPKKIVGALSLSLLLYGLSKNYHRFLYHPQFGNRYNKDNAQQNIHPIFRGLDAEDLSIEGEDQVVVRGWHIKNKEADKVIVYFHENAGNIGNKLFFVEKMVHHLKADVVLVAYRGYSDSDGKSPTEQGILKDAKAIMKTSCEIAKARKLPLLIYGRSLGGAVGIYAASLPQFRRQVAGLILENTFTSIKDVAFSILKGPFLLLFPVIWLVLRKSWLSLERIRYVECPVLLIKGCKDELVPKRLMDELEEKCIKHKVNCFAYEVKDGSHNDTWYINQNQYFKRINDYFQFITHRSSL